MQVPYVVFQWACVIGNFAMAYGLFKLAVMVCKRNIDHQKVAAFSKGLTVESNLGKWKRTGFMSNKLEIAKVSGGSVLAGAVIYYALTALDKLNG